MREKELMDMEIVNNLHGKIFEQPGQKNCIGEDRTDNRLVFDADSSCGRKPLMKTGFSQLAGYENLCVNTYHLQPERKNTYHNYPVLQKNGDFCSMNHQIFRNHTKRNLNSSIYDEINEKSNINDLIPEAIPLYLQMNNCNKS
jgi:hypothetical protein